MKKSKRLVAIVVALIMAATVLMGLTSSAAGPGSITIEALNPENLVLNGQTFDAYRIFEILTIKEIKVDPDDPDSDVVYSFAYKIVEPFDQFKNYPNSATQSLTEYLSSGLVGHSDDMNTLAGNLWAFIEDFNKTAAPADRIVPEGTVTVPALIAGGVPVTETKIENIPLGYYLVFGSGYADGDAVDGKVIAACALTSTKPDATVILKADAPKLDKLIWNHHTALIPSDPKDQKLDGPADIPGDWIRWNDVSIGQTVYFRLNTAVPQMIGYTVANGGYTFTIHDRMSAGLTFNLASVEIYLGGTRDEYVAGGSVEKLVVGAGNDYTVFYSPTPVAPPVPADGCTFDIVFNPLKFVTYTPEKEIYIYYSADLNENAVIELPGNPNEAQLEYSNNPYKVGEEGGTNKTPWRKVKVYTGKYGFIKTLGDKIPTDDVNKEDVMYDKDGDMYYVETLPGAEFELYEHKLDADGKPIIDDTTIIWFKEDTSNPKEYVYTVVAAGTPGAKTRMTTPAGGRVQIIGLGASYEEYDMLLDNNGDPVLGADGKPIFVHKGHKNTDEFGYYYLVERKAPAGYVLQPKPIPIQLHIYCVYEGWLIDDNGVFEADWNRYYNEQDDEIDWLIVQNGNNKVGEWLLIKNFLGEFPPTGGSGRRNFIIGGIALMGLAVVGMVVTSATRKKKIIDIN